MAEKRFTLEQEYDVDGHAEDCYVDNVTGKIYYFDDEFCDYNFLKDVNNIIETLTHENDELKNKIKATKDLISVEVVPELINVTGLKGFDGKKINHTNLIEKIERTLF